MGDEDDIESPPKRSKKTAPREKEPIVPPTTPSRDREEHREDAPRPSV
jgi:hypothetical protein